MAENNKQTVSDILEMIPEPENDNRWTVSQTTEKDYASEEKELGLELKREELESIKQDRKQRGLFSICIFAFVCVYMVVALFILYLAGRNTIMIDDTVLIVLLSTTTANVIGLFVVVTNYLFHHK